MHYSASERQARRHPLLLAQEVLYFLPQSAWMKLNDTMRHAHWCFKQKGEIDDEHELDSERTYMRQYTSSVNKAQYRSMIMRSQTQSSVK